MIKLRVFASLLMMEEFHTAGGTHLSFFKAVLYSGQFVYFKISFFYKLSENSVSILGSRLL